MDLTWIIPSSSSVFMAVQVMEFQVWGSKLERFLPRNQHKPKETIEF